MREGRVGEREDHVDVRIASGVCGGEGVFDVRLELPHGRGECFQTAYMRRVLLGDDRQTLAYRLRSIGDETIGLGDLEAQVIHLLGDDDEGAARPAATRRLDLGVEREQSGLASETDNGHAGGGEV